MKKLVVSLVVVFALICTCASAQEVAVLVNDNSLDSPVPAQIVNSRTMVPMRAIFERLGASVEWVAEERMIVALKDSFLITMKIDEPIMTVQDATSNEMKKIELDVAPFIENGSTLVPVRAVSESLGAEVLWNAETYTVTINTK